MSLPIEGFDDHLVWHRLNMLCVGDQVTELMAASEDDGIGFIARWIRQEDGTWSVWAIDTESDQGMQRVTDFHEGEPIPPEPPPALLKLPTTS